MKLWFARRYLVGWGLVAATLLVFATFYIPSPWSAQCIERLSGAGQNTGTCLVAVGLLTHVRIDNVGDGNLIVPVAVFESNFLPVRGVVIHLTGGPGDLFDLLHAWGWAYQNWLLAARGFRVVAPAYSGTYYRSKYPQASVDAAADEIAAVTRWAERTFPWHKPCLAAYSLGGYLIQYASLKPEHAWLRSIPKIFVNPGLVSPRIRYDNALRLASISTVDGLPRVKRYVYKNFLSLTPDKRIKPMSVLEQDVYSVFFGDKMDFDVSTLSPNPNLSIYYSALDAVRTPEQINGYRLAKPNRLIPLEAKEHRIWKDRSRWQLENEIADGIANCASS